MRKEELEKEIRLTEAVCSQLRMKKLDLEAEVSNLSNDIVGFAQDIRDMEKVKKDLSVEIGGLKEKKQKADDEINKQLKDIAKQRADLDQIKASQKDEWIFIDETKVNNMKEADRLVKEGQRIKAMAGALAQKEQALQIAKNTLADREVKISSYEKEHDKQMAEIKDMQVSTLKHQEEAVNRIEEVVKLKTSAEAKIKDAENKMKQAEAMLHAAKEAEKQIVAEKAELATAKEENEKTSTELLQKTSSLQKQYEALHQKEDEIEVKRLRVEKLIKDRDLKEELSKLQKELG